MRVCTYVSYMYGGGVFCYTTVLIIFLLKLWICIIGHVSSSVVVKVFSNISAIITLLQAEVDIYVTDGFENLVYFKWFPEIFHLPLQTSQCVGFLLYIVKQYLYPLHGSLENFGYE